MVDKRILDVSKNIRILRKKKGYMQTELAERIGASPASVYNWEKGRVEPKISNLYAMAEVLDADITDFFKWRGDE